MLEFKSSRSDVVPLRNTQTTVDYEYRASEPSDSVDLPRLARAIWKRKWLILVTTIAVAALFFVTTSLQPRQFTAAATVILDPREQQVIAAQDQVVSDLKLNNPIIESEVALLRSSSLLTKVIGKIGIDRFNVIDPALAEPSLLQKAIGTVKGLVRGAPDAEPEATEPSRPALIPPERLRELRIIGALRDGIDIRRVGESYVIETVVTTTDPELSALVANTLARSYIEEQLADRQRVAEGATRWLADQVELRRVELTAAETAVENYKRDQLDETGTSQDVLDQQLGELNQQIAQARSERATEEARLKRIETLLEERGALAAAETQSSSYLASLRNEREVLAREDARLAISLGPNHRDRQLIASELRQIDTSISVEVANIADSYRNEIDVLQIRENALQANVDALESQLSDMAADSLELRQLEREAEASRGSYEELLARLGETRAQVEIQRAEAKLVTEAQIPAGPSAPRVRLMTGFGATLGLTMAMIMALAMELMGSGLKQANELEKMTGLPILSTIPRVRLTRPTSILRFLSADSYSLLAERIRQLRTVLMLKTPAGQPLSVLVLSSVPNEGKTATSLALAKSFANLGRKTIFVDLDTRRSVVFNELTKDAPKDLADWLNGKATLSEAIAELDDLGIAVTGTREKSAIMADGTGANRIKALFDELEKRYEVIIVDSPPILAVSDGLSLADAVTHLIYLVSFAKTPRKSVIYGLTVLANVGIRPTGLVMTMADSDDDPNSYAKGYDY